MSWRANRAYFLVLLFYFAASAVIAWTFELKFSYRIYAESLFVIGSAASVALFTIVSIRTIMNKPNHLFKEIYKKVFIEYKIIDRCIIGIPVLVTFPLMLSAFTSMKSNISKIIPFYADIFLIEIERTMLGMDAWQFFHPILGFPLVTVIINFFYNIWFIVLSAVFFVVIFSLEDDRHTRMRFLVSYVLLWAILGSFAATLGASVGPVYVEHFYADKSFAPLVAYLNNASQSYPIWALETQAWLLERSSTDGPTVGSGISAFPSMHVAVAALYPLYFWRRGHIFRVVSLAFLGLIFLGSVHLGWHYAIDGYASILAVLLIWHLVGRVLDRRPGRGVKLPEEDRCS